MLLSFKAYHCNKYQIYQSQKKERIVDDKVGDINVRTSGRAAYRS